MKVCAISFKECWQDQRGVWFSSGGFPTQMSAIASLFDEMTLLIVQGEQASGGIPLPPAARVIPLRGPSGVDTRRKFSVVAQLPYYLRELGRYIKHADVVHVPLPGDLPLLGLLVALAQRKPLIARYGGSWASTSQTTLMNRVTKACLAGFAGGRNVMLATGLGDRPPAKNMHWLFVSVISQAELSSVRPDLDRNAQNPLQLAYAGRLSEEKGVDILVRALGLLRKEYDPSRIMPCLTIIGEGPQRAELAAMVASEGLGDIVRFTGQLNRADLFQCLSGADICVLPSLTESFGKARLDAMLCGVPVITTEVGFGREILGQDGERGWLVPSGDAFALADALRRAVAGPVQWPALRRRCRHYAEGFILETWIQNIGAICARQWGISLVEGKLQV